VKTFKLISLQIKTKHNEYIDIELADGLIINKEDERSTWLIEAFVIDENLSKFESNFAGQQELMVQVVITKKDNDPATFKTILRMIKKVDGHSIILLEGHLQKTRSRYAELLLQDLIQKGIDGTELVEQFKEKIRTRPKLSIPNKP
jgi:hypothetical protein